MHPEVHGNSSQSLAEATVRPGRATMLHKHLRSEELYHVLSGSGRMTLDGQVFPLAVGDTICIAPGTAHMVENMENQDLVILCCCSPPYSHSDTKLL
jgi:mannose-6-phosphate isomerase-like protein (cupin superfamily)